jgi:hypothetical protein
VTWIVDVSAPAGTSCGGCTTGGLACVGLNSCQGGCLSGETRDCCGSLQSTSVCCPSCTTAGCSPNTPCGGTKPNTIVSDTCTPVAGVPTACQYYARRDACVGGKCPYYSIESPKQCKSPPFTVSSLPAPILDCIRPCLQTADSKLTSSEKTANGCPKFDSIVSYHETCFEGCGISKMRFPTKLFWAFGKWRE